jgi:hypothetical protein
MSHVLIVVVHRLLASVPDPMVLVEALQAMTYLAAAALALIGHRPALAFTIYLLIALTHLAAAMLHYGTVP